VAGHPHQLRGTLLTASLPTADTANNTQVRNYIVDALKSLNWHIEEDSFTDETPFGVKTFTNVIATKDPEASRRVIVAAHHDSKFFPSYPENQVGEDSFNQEFEALKPPQFVGATDSAMPCAMMLDLAEVLDPLLNSRLERLENGLEDDEYVSETTLQLIFFDGEEAFKDWTATDSIYGARCAFLFDLLTSGHSSACPKAPGTEMGFKIY
jgi:glutaminyl-peptide cyclotransferase